MTRDTQALLVLGGALAVAFAGLAVLVLGSTRRAELVVRGGEDGGDPASRRFIELIDVRLKRSARGRRLENWLRAAGAPVGAADLVGIIIGAAVVLGLLLMLFLPPIFAAVFGIAIPIGVARWWGERLRAARSEAFIQQLPELARTLSNASSAGLSMIGAVQLTARELADPAGTELKSVVQEMRLGRSLDEALENLRERLPSREAAVLVTTITIQQRAGGDTVRALSELSETLEARKDLRREVRTLLAGTVYTAYLVAGMGVGTILLINLITPGVLHKMFTSVVGLIAVVVSTIMYVVGLLVIRRTTKVDV